MPPDIHDMAYLWDMLDAARAITDFVKGKRFEHYLHDRMLRNAVERNLEIIGEAARHVSTEFRDAHPEIPWKAIIAQRNVLSHEYGEIRHERIWAVSGSHLSDLVRILTEIGVEKSPDSDVSNCGYKFHDK